MPEVRACVQVCAGVSTNPPCASRVPGFVDLHARYRRRAGLRKAIARRRGGPGAPRVSLSSASFRFRCRSDPDVFSAPVSSWQGSAGLFEKNAEKVAKLGGYRVAKDSHGGSAVRRELLPNQSIILNSQNAETGRGIRSMTSRPSTKGAAARVRCYILR